MCKYPLRLKNGNIVPCGICLECQQQKSKEWAFRCLLESLNYKDNCFLTLTYNETYNPGVVVKKDLQDFLKRLRYFLGDKKIKYFSCGEYGSKGKRPHYHLVIFGWKPSDLIFLKKTKKNEYIYRSPFIEQCWRFGFSSCGDLTYESCKYTAVYLQKSNNVPHELVQQGVRTKFIENPPFCLMSKGLGLTQLTRQMIVNDKIYFKGNYVKIPRYFLDKYALKDWSIVNRLKKKRHEIMLLKSGLKDFEKNSEK